ncbi:hypothetical protein EPA93_19075 [Ktedonosporobacter rubrisoli]|uniref:Uncharacterized protein n=1 Tax=Ktedonosporobacter rubrisoli TaxID=2509675 RepID=A0A4P6JRP3_KTERU|nr:hypothetical protein [Ktedonosporobacter rubrisoli]QBD77983.1 hypothetical protein EPA93_19075 [Ktedonosporobacter rubrisoli]
MNIPVTIGLPQLLLFLLGLIGLSLLISCVMELSRGHVEKYVSERGEHRYRRRRRLRWGRGLSGVVLALLALSLLWATFLVQTYLGLTSDIRVAQVRAAPLEGIPHLMSVELVLYDKDGHQVMDKTYPVQGDEWMLQGDIIKFPGWLNILGLHSGYKLTRLEGRFDDPNLESNAKHTVITLNGGDDNFFRTVQQQAWVSPVVEAAYGNAVFLAADSKSYDIFVSQTGLYAKPAK